MSDKCLYCKKNGELVRDNEYKDIKYHKNCHQEYKNKTEKMWNEYDKITSRN